MRHSMPGFVLMLGKALHGLLRSLVVGRRAPGLLHRERHSLRKRALVAHHGAVTVMIGRWTHGMGEPSPGLELLKVVRAGRGSVGMDLRGIECVAKVSQIQMKFVWLVGPGTMIRSSTGIIRAF